MILRETVVKAGEVLWKAGDQAKFGLVVKEGEFKFFGCVEAEIGIIFKVIFYKFNYNIFLQLINIYCDNIDGQLYW